LIIALLFGILCFLLRWIVKKIERMTILRSSSC
jgi:hypothetical protein